ncbi:hypothetical protein BQ8420_28815 [Nocardiopsis sp. JB363]|nr:hypothetical protein BQ8420_28815 [Nocardiopsis sp. JB363]
MSAPCFLIDHIILLGGDPSMPLPVTVGGHLSPDRAKGPGVGRLGAAAGGPRGCGSENAWRIRMRPRRGLARPFGHVERGVGVDVVRRLWEGSPRSGALP